MITTWVYIASICRGNNFVEMAEQHLFDDDNSDKSTSQELTIRVINTCDLKQHLVQQQQKNYLFHVQKEQPNPNSNKNK